MTLQLLHSEFSIYEENFIFFFISVDTENCTSPGGVELHATTRNWNTNFLLY
jgi:hypothetical protein